MWNVARSNLSDGLELETMSVDESTVDISGHVMFEGTVCIWDSTSTRSDIERFF